MSKHPIGNTGKDTSLNPDNFRNTVNSNTHDTSSDTELQGEILSLDKGSRPGVLTIEVGVRDLLELFARHRQAAVDALLDELERSVDGLEVDIEATTEHIQSVGGSDNDILNMEIEADDRKAILDDVRALLTQKRKERKS